ncbi:thioesterase domain-containing protein [Fusobacterium necrophorum]|uniref:thioesterase II family protein n=1 Tax=Fusobacterium necrophorum TaxID=859 RepID=UPI00254F3F67|nr:thioesterase domain-containing protein [Fusobacterium necrophorum]MDK4501207.1 thioesterase domain-containing protein [Fusobacterium necrophorum]
MGDWFEIINKSIISENARLIMFPYAGGGTSVFRKWEKLFCDVRLYAVQYPGRENRMSEEPIKDFDILLNEVFKNLIKIIDDDRPYYLFGHSLGTKLVYELTLRIMNDSMKKPSGIIVSGGKAPCFKEENPIYHLDDIDFIKGINRYSGTPEEIIQNIEIMKIFLPMLRADFMIDETYQRKEIEKIDIPILGLMGTDDKELKIEELKKWEEYTTKDFKYRYIEGGHMFINTNTELVAKEISSFINENVKNN